VVVPLALTITGSLEPTLLDASSPTLVVETSAGITPSTTGRSSRLLRGWDLVDFGWKKHTPLARAMLLNWMLHVVVQSHAKSSSASA
jgi:hypothetical protein